MRTGQTHFRGNYCSGTQAVADKGRQMDNPQETFECTRCNKLFFLDGFKVDRLGRRLKTCLEFNARSKTERERYKCPHGRQTVGVHPSVYTSTSELSAASAPPRAARHLPSWHNFGFPRCYRPGPFRQLPQLQRGGPTILWFRDWRRDLPNSVMKGGFDVTNMTH